MNLEQMRRDLVDVVIDHPNNRVMQNHRNEWPKLWAVIDEIVYPDLDAEDDEPSFAEQAADRFWESFRPQLIALINTAMSVSELAELEREQYPTQEMEATYEGEKLVGVSDIGVAEAPESDDNASRHIHHGDAIETLGKIARGEFTVDDGSEE